MVRHLGRERESPPAQRLRRPLDLEARERIGRSIVEKAYGIRRRTDLTAARPTRLSDGFMADNRPTTACLVTDRPNLHGGASEKLDERLGEMSKRLTIAESLQQP